jgi:hypothetical protein
MMKNIKKNLNLIILYFFLAIFAFVINFWTGSRGVFEIDTFVHFDPAVNILDNILPIRDLWIVHGLTVDLIQSIFFYFLGINWNAYLSHGSLFNAIITIVSFHFYLELDLTKLQAFIIALCISILAYPVSATPFLDLHATFFSLIAIYLLILAIKYEKNIYIYFSIILLGLAFFSKQVPTAYIILFYTIFIIFYSSQIKKIAPLAHSFISLVIFLLVLFIYLLISGTKFSDLIFQLFIFPIMFGSERFSSYELNIKNIFWQFKFIYIFLLPIIYIYSQKITKKKFFKTKKFNYFIIILFFTLSLMYHQIFTKNQIFIFFLVPVLSGFLVYSINQSSFNKKKILINLTIILCLLITIKYHYRYNVDRKFHELSKVNLNQAILINFEKDFFNNLQWISLNFKNPEKEIKIIKEFYLLLKSDPLNKILITGHNYFSGLMDEKIYSPSRTYDDISYPQKGSYHYNIYKNHLKNYIKKYKIKNIYVFETSTIVNERLLNHLIFNYIPSGCFIKENINIYINKLKIVNCKELKN